MKQLFTVGETARLNNVSVQTLHYYDKIDIFKPHVIDPENGYRYYHLRQFFYLDIIKYLKQIQTPLEEIKNIVTTSCTPEVMQTFLGEQEKVIDQEIEKLQRSQRLLLRRKDQLREQLEICAKNEEGAIYNRHIEEQSILKVVNSCEADLYDQSDFNFRRLADVLEERGEIIDNYFGFIFELFPYAKFEAIRCSSVFTKVCQGEKLELDEADIQLETIPSGEYVCIAFDWSRDNFYSHYQSLYRYIETNQIPTDGKVYQVSLPINYDSSREEQFLTELRVKINVNSAV
ncbi:MerR family DNA-binding transcriptional regulator [Paenibacillus sp. ACRRY]|uniref:MerR family transcriptional regulator n=1 Tax=Paenibacillus sp. ACRRY TaxID=2918208 RepID=UPI001EF4EAF5|nr:MerR family DNA-binding transcriptional regulator [Paenibacillus sp. ACRRY]MCG7381370.1 MerR family transcriptional regulator [Paenibacillus sp. ACRRY]